jgi:uncharacterized membrane protein
MNRREYMNELYQRLGPLPLTLEDVNDAMRFYEEYFDEAGPEREQAVIAELGSPAYVAAQVALKLTGSLTPSATQRKEVKKNVSVIALIIIGIFAAPVALPLALGVVLAIASLLFAAFMVVVSFGISGIACMVTGVGVTLYSVSLLFTSGFGTGVYFMGSGLLAVGIGGFLAKFGWWLCALFVKGAKSVGKWFLRKIRKEEVFQHA